MIYQPPRRADNQMPHGANTTVLSGCRLQRADSLGTVPSGAYDISTTKSGADDGAKSTKSSGCQPTRVNAEERTEEKVKTCKPPREKSRYFSNSKQEQNMKVLAAIAAEQESDEEGENGDLLPMEVEKSRRK